ncbi:MAG: MATE family efflux transporter [Candidatus Limivivens sp.]|nr:MATE family efflux transporter [Candidatus Limivivens sp.]
MRKFIGDRKFYRMVLTILIPIVIQNGITNFVSLLDNIMVGQVGTEQMSGVAIANQLVFVFNLCIFGAVSGAGIFGAQYYGSGDQEGVRDTLRFKLVISALLFLAGAAVFLAGGERLISLYLTGESTGNSAEQTLKYGQSYLRIMLFGMLPFTIVQSYSSTLRETGETVLPMKAGIVSVLVNLSLNYLLIFGKLGLPALGANGAAIATVIARYVEGIVIVVQTHRHSGKYRFVRGIFRDFRIPLSLTGQIIRKGMPLMVNETLWSMGMAILMQCYSVRGLAVVAGLNISSTITNLFNAVFLSMGNAVAIIIGQLLGAGKMEEARDTDYKLIFFSVASCIAVGGCMALFAPFFPLIYNTTEEVRHMARNFIWVSALCMPLNAFTNVAYFTLRSGGKTLITFFFDSGYVWAVSIPLAYVLSRFTELPILPLYSLCQFADIFKCAVGYVLVKKGVWIQKVVGNQV